MSDNLSMKKQIYELCYEIYKYEKFLLNSIKDQRSNFNMLFNRF